MNELRCIMIYVMICHRPFLCCTIILHLRFIVFDRAHLCDTPVAAPGSAWLWSFIVVPPCNLIFLFSKRWSLSSFMISCPVVPVAAWRLSRPWSLITFFSPFLSSLCCVFCWCLLFPERWSLAAFASKFAWPSVSLHLGSHGHCLLVWHFYAFLSWFAFPERLSLAVCLLWLFYSPVTFHSHSWNTSSK